VKSLRRSGIDHPVLPAITYTQLYYTNACLYLVSVHQMPPPETEVANI